MKRLLWERIWNGSYPRNTKVGTTSLKREADFTAKTVCLFYCLDSFIFNFLLDIFSSVQWNRWEHQLYKEKRCAYFINSLSVRLCWSGIWWGLQWWNTQGKDLLVTQEAERVAGPGYAHMPKSYLPGTFYLTNLPLSLSPRNHDWIKFLPLIRSAYNFGCHIMVIL